MAPVEVFVDVTVEHAAIEYLKVLMDLSSPFNMDDTFIQLKT
jgi:hypothetical protein